MVPLNRGWSSALAFGTLLKFEAQRIAHAMHEAPAACYIYYMEPTGNRLKLVLGAADAYGCLHSSR